MVKSKKSNTKARKNLKARVHKAVRPAKAKRPKPAIKHKGRSAPRNKTELRKHVKVVSIASKQKLAHGATTLPGKEKAAEAGRR